MAVDRVDLRDRFRGALLGTFCGDALGAAHEGWRPHETAGALDSPAELLRRSHGRYTDDTEMMIALAESLVERGGEVEPAHLARTFLRRYDPSRGYGPGTVRTLNAISRGARWDAASAATYGGGGSYGNGSAMRVAPVGVLFHHDLEALRGAAEAQARVTHAHPLGTAGAALQAAAVALAVRAEGPGDLAPDRVLDALRTFVGGFKDPSAVEAYLERLEAIEVMLSDSGDPPAVARALGTSATCPRSVPAAIYSALVRRGSPGDALVYAVSLGGDTDTIGAMAGAIAGALHGASALPAEWLALLEEGPRGRSHVASLADRLHEVWTRIHHAP
jgi:poly(ADP-ribose) glycohydrolase ARH3